MDEYTEVIARYPNAKQIDFIGHSNGTYILASALERYSSLCVHRAVFAGSVVNRNYDWRRRMDARQVKSIRNYVGSADWVVGYFPGFFELCRSREIGTAGFNGFEQDAGNRDEVRFVNGSHSCALDAVNRPSIIDYIIRDARVDPAGKVDKQSPRVVFFSKACWIIWLLIVAAILGVGYGVWLLPLGFEVKLAIELAWCVILVTILYRL